MASTSNKASKQAAANEAARQASITNTQSAVNGVFDGPQRQKDIADYVDATRTYYGDDLSRQKATNDRQLKFALARGGLTGGSTQIDQQKLAGEDYTRGLLSVQRKAAGAGADLASADQDARSRLISLATSGLDATTAASMAASSLRSNLESGQATAQAQGLGDVFGTGAKFYQAAQDSAARRRGNRDAGFNLYGPSASTGFYYGGGRGG